MAKDEMTCGVCGNKLCEPTAGRVSHFRAHVKNGELIEGFVNGRCIWTMKDGTILKAVNEKKIEELRISSNYDGIHGGYVTTKTEAKLTGKGYEIKCRKCGKWIKARVSAADERFMSATCRCNGTVLTLFPVRFLSDQMNKVVGFE